MSEKLLPCPFCGGTDFKIDHELGVTISHTCENRVNYPRISVNAQTEDSARSGWNRRAAQPAPVAAQPILYQHTDGRYGLSLHGQPAAFTEGDPGWYRVPIDVLERAKERP